MGGHKFRRQRPVGSYIVDFVCLERRVVVEVDGGQHNERRFLDAQRDAWLCSEGYEVLRFWNNEVLTQIDGVKEAIFQALTKPPP
jgi:very-short-patch-repair endonuclease